MSDTKQLSKLSDEELLAEAKKVKSKAFMNAFIIGFLIGIVLYSVFKSTWGLVTLLPLFLAYKLINNSKYDDKELKALLTERGLK